MRFVLTLPILEGRRHASFPSTDSPRRRHLRVELTKRPFPCTDLMQLAVVSAPPTSRATCPSLLFLPFALYSVQPPLRPVLSHCSSHRCMQLVWHHEPLVLECQTETLGVLTGGARILCLFQGSHQACIMRLAEKSLLFPDATKKSSPPAPQSERRQARYRREKPSCCGLNPRCADTIRQDRNTEDGAHGLDTNSSSHELIWGINTEFWPRTPFVPVLPMHGARRPLGGETSEPDIGLALLMAERVCEQKINVLSH
jgi:hypothetical protein